MLKSPKHTLPHATLNQTNDRIELVHSGTDYFERLQQIILNAKSEIHIQTYIFANDGTGSKIIEALKIAASRKVNIFIIVDGYGSYNFSAEVVSEMKRQGIAVRFFSPIFSSNGFYIGRRLHHKIVVADKKIVLIGGINIADKYHGSSLQEPWLDYAVQIEHAGVASSIAQLCTDLYFKNRVGKIESMFSFAEKTEVHILQNDWLKGKNEIAKDYIKTIRNTREELIIVGGYFLPGRRLLKAIKKASMQGVKVKLILAGIFDVPLMGLATRYLCSLLLKYNIEIYQWHKSVLHGKAAIADREWTTVGSFNLNHLSSYGSIEMNARIHSSEFSKKFALHLDEVISKCEKVTQKKENARNGIVSKALSWCAYHLVRFSLILITYKRFRE